MQLVVVSAPGRGSGPHWSTELAAAVVACARRRGFVDVHWLCALAVDQPAPTDPAAVVFRRASRASPARVGRDMLDAPLERALTRRLRQTPLARVLHLGLGAGGTPNVAWLADRLGSPAFACARGDELVCARGDLVDRHGEVCERWHDVARCRWCCGASWWRSRPRAAELHNRTDLCVASLQACRAVFLTRAADAPLLAGLGVAAERVRVGAGAAELCEAVFDEARAAP